MTPENELELKITEAVKKERDRCGAICSKVLIMAIADDNHQAAKAAQSIFDWIHGGGE